MFLNGIWSWVAHILFRGPWQIYNWKTNWLVMVKLINLLGLTSTQGVKKVHFHVCSAGSWGVALGPVSGPCLCFFGAILLSCFPAAMNEACLLHHILPPWGSCLRASLPWAEFPQTTSQINLSFFKLLVLLCPSHEKLNNAHVYCVINSSHLCT